MDEYERALLGWPVTDFTAGVSWGRLARSWLCLICSGRVSGWRAAERTGWSSPFRGPDAERSLAAALPTHRGVAPEAGP